MYNRDQSPSFFSLDLNQISPQTPVTGQILAHKPQDPEKFVSIEFLLNYRKFYALN